jgi:small ligand-binding sensory domain FIST
MREHSPSNTGSAENRGHTPPRIAIGASTSNDTLQAAHEAADQLLGRTGAQDLQLLLVFFSPQHVDRAEELAALLQSRLKPHTLLGVSSFAPICGERELERGPSISLMGFCVPGLRCTAVALDDLPEVAHAEQANLEPTHEEQPPTESAPYEDAAAATPSSPADTSHPWLDALALRDHDAFAVLTLVDPFSVAMTQLLPDIQLALSSRAAALPQCLRPTLVGGLASSSMKAGGNALLLGSRVLRAGGVVCTLSGPLHIDCVVSQGCRPIGAPMIVTRAKNNLVYELGGSPVLDVIERALQPLGDQREAYLRRGLFLGLAADEFKPRFGRGDFLIRNVVAGDRELGYIAIADVPRIGQTVRLHVRDPKAATEDLELLLDAQKLYDAPLGALLITCNSRGERFFGGSGHDARAVARLFDTREQSPDPRIDPLPSPLWIPPPQAAVDAEAEDPLSNAPLYDPSVTPPAIAGFFAAGEIGPVGPRSHLHGHTACVVLFRERLGNTQNEHTRSE